MPSLYGHEAMKVARGYIGSILEVKYGCYVALIGR